MTLVLAFALLGCGDQTKNDTDKTNSPNIIDVNNAGSNLIDPAAISRLGEACGPSSEKFCASGLSCQFEGMQQDAGLCLPVVVNPDLECDETQNAVCGLIGNNKNGYLNECYAQRYGAQVLNEGFCKNDETVKGSCDSPAYSLGNCQQSFTGASFNQASGECEAVTLVGCSADMPFESLEACQSSCS